MKCKICGAKLKKEGDICTACYKEYQEEEDLKKDKKVTLKLKRKCDIPYEITKYTELFLIGIVASFWFFLAGNILNGLATLGIILLVFLILLIWDKRIAKATKVIFYEKKCVYKFKFLFIDIKKTVKYSDISDVTFYTTFRQRRYGYGDLCIYAKGAIPGKTLLNGFQIKNVENVAEVLEEIRGIVGNLN